MTRFPNSFSHLKLGLVLAWLLLITACGPNVPPPAPYGPLPTEHQLAWQKMEYYMFIHFGPNTFTDVEWGHGKEDPKVFNPSQLDCRQWAATAKAAGMKAIIITAKHHDGFCLWPSEYSTHTVRESLWKNGKGDVLRELSDACKEYGLKFGVYLSPWDQNHPAYGTPEYNQIFANTLTEVLSNYGHVYEQWFDGACGEGPNGKRQVYDWDLFYKTVYSLQPHAIIFSDIGPGCRWMGNERGIGGETNWSTLNIKGFGMGVDAPATDVLNKGNMNGEKWIPAEVDVSIRPGWFYSASTDDKVKSLSHLVDIYNSSVGRNANLLLNVPPDRRGLIHPNDSTRLMELRKVLDKTFATDLAKGAKATATHTRGNARMFGTRNLFDNDYDTYWSTDDGQLTASIEVDLGKEQLFNRVVLQEYIPLGQRVKQFSLEYWDGAAWVKLDQQTTIGYKRILHFPTIAAQKLRINIEDALACPTLNAVSVYKAPEILTSPVITRNKEGQVSIRSESSDPVIYYTLDGTEPSPEAIRYTGTFELPKGGTVLAKAFVDNNSRQSETVKADYDIAPGKWTIVGKSGELERRGVAENAIDALNHTAWTTISPLRIDEAKPIRQPQFIAIDLGEAYNLKGFFYVPVPNGFKVNLQDDLKENAGRFSKAAGCNIATYNFYTSEDGKNWKSVVSKGTFGNIKNNPVRQDVIFDAPVTARYIKLECVASVCAELPNGSNNATVAEIGILTR